LKATNSQTTVFLNYHVSPGGCLTGRIRVPGDKSISHRAIMLGSLASGTTHIDGFLEGEDALATLQALRAMGVGIDGPQNGRVRIEGVGLKGLKPAHDSLDCGNSGTSIRLLAGLLSGQDFDSELTGDASLLRRPMNRVVLPLRSMGADIHAAEGGLPPLKIHGGRPLRGIDYVMPVASAQVKSALLLAGLFARGTTCVVEPAPTRDHTERMLHAFGCSVQRNGNRICITGNQELQATSINVPADISSAAFFMVGASIAPDSDLVLEAVGVNPTRTGVLDILRLMGAHIELHNERLLGDEPVADIRVTHAPLHGIRIPTELVPLAIDEFPILCIAAANAVGETLLTGAQELRVKESDRIQAMADGLIALGIKAQTMPDGIRIAGGAYGSGEIDSQRDHRIAMAFAMAGLRAAGPIHISNCDNVATSFPGFDALSQACGLPLAVERRG
jgi:3-phosphoshikimate 1-carboxyvinyltransferase